MDDSKIKLDAIMDEKNEMMDLFLGVVESELNENPSRDDIHKVIRNVFHRGQFIPSGNLQMAMLEHFVRNRLDAKKP